MILASDGRGEERKGWLVERQAADRAKCWPEESVERWVCVMRKDHGLTLECGGSHVL